VTDPDARDDQGLFAVLYRDVPLLTVVAEVARRIDPDEPQRVSQPRFDRGRGEAGSALGFPKVPSASAIYQRFNRTARSNGNAKLSWQRILALGLGSVDPTQALAASTRSDEDEFDTRHLWFAMRAIAQHLELSGLTRSDYSRGTHI
jgi:hypothetical protein